MDPLVEKIVRGRSASLGTSFAGCAARPTATRRLETAKLRIKKATTLRWITLFSPKNDLTYSKSIYSDGSYSVWWQPFGDDEAADRHQCRDRGDCGCQQLMRLKLLPLMQPVHDQDTHFPIVHFNGP